MSWHVEHKGMDPVGEEDSVEGRCVLDTPGSR